MEIAVRRYFFFKKNKNSTRCCVKAIAQAPRVITIKRRN